MNIGDKVRVVKVNPLHRAWLRKYYKKVGTVVEIVEVTPSKRVPDGKIFRVKFPVYKSQKFISRELKKLDLELDKAL